jgi:hypothetical protein
VDNATETKVDNPKAQELETIQPSSPLKEEVNESN